MTEKELEQINKLMTKELEKTQEVGEYRVFQKPLELEIAKRLAESKDKSPMAEGMFVLYAELKHTLITLAQEQSQAVALLDRHGISHNFSKMAEE